MLRGMLLGLVGTAAVCGAAVAGPPGLQPRPHVEGRELDPVTRDHFLPEPPAVVNEAPALSSTADRDSFLAVLLGAHQAVTHDFTMLLGTARPGGL